MRSTEAGGCPRSILLARLDRRFDKRDAPRAVQHIRGERRALFGRTPGAPGRDQFRRAAVQVGETFDITFGMAAGHARAFNRKRRVSRTAAPQDTRRLAIGREAERLRLLACPFEPGARTVDLDAQIVEIADRDLACRERAARAA